MKLDLKSLQHLPPWEWPDGVEEQILAILEKRVDADHKDRLCAATMAGDISVMNDELADLLLGIVRNAKEPTDVRCQAAISLGPALELAEISEFDPDESPISEITLIRVQKALKQLHMDGDVPAELQRSILEASVRAPQDWHARAVRAAYRSDDDAWQLTAVFCMEYISGFDAEILEVLAREDDESDMLLHAVTAAGNWELDEAWDRIAAIINEGDADGDRWLLTAAIEAAATIRPEQAQELIAPLLDHEDEEIAAVASEAMAMAELGAADDSGDWP